jgi:serine/threonine-protein kinase
MLNEMSTPSPATVPFVPDTAPAGLPSFDGYQVMELVGRGGMGKVYRARHVALGRVVAIKVMTHEQDERLTARFRDEARAVAKLQHPNIAQLFDTGTSDGRPYYSLEFADGGTLADRWDGKPQDPAAVAAVMETVARAIQHSHEHGILHRDLKPGNVLLAADGTPKVADFGLAKELPSAAAGVSTLPGGNALTRTGEVVGTPAYMSPEQASGVTSSLTPAADVYSLGAMLYEGLTGRPPFTAPDALQTLFLVLASDPVPPKTLQPKLTADLNTICLKCLEKQPKKRYATAGELADDLGRWRRGEPIVARPVGRVERAVKWARRNRAGAALAGVSVLLVLAVIGFGVLEAINAVRLRAANDALAAKNEELGQANADLEKSKRETEAMLGYALNTLEEYHFELSDRLATVPAGEKLRVEVLQLARKTLDELYDANPRRKAVWDHLVNGYQRLGNALHQIGDAAGAETAYARAEAAARRLVEFDPSSVANKAARGQLLLQRAGALNLLGREAEAGECVADGLRLAAELDASHPKDVDVIRLNLLAVGYSYRSAIAASTAESMVPVYRRWVELYARLAGVLPDDPAPRRRAVEYELTLSGLYAQLGKFAEAEDILTRSKATVDTLPDAVAPSVRQLRAAYHEGVGALADSRDRPADAETAFRHALAEYQGLVKDFPNSPNYRNMLVGIWSKIANVWVYRDQPAKGLHALQTARGLAADLARDFPDNPRYKSSLDVFDSQLRLLTPPEKK